MPAAFLPDRALIRITGVPAEHFLQNLITTDVVALAPGEAWPGALLTPQGKILFDFLVWRIDGGFMLETAASQRDDLIKRLTMYKLRTPVDIAAEAEDGVTVSWGEDALDGGLVDRRFSTAGIPLSRRPGDHGDHPVSGYDVLRILAGIPESGSDFALQDAFPHDVMLDLMNGLSFRKGCYVGQEVVSRMQHRGTARRRPVIVTAQTPLPATGAEMTAGGKPIGTLGTVAGSRALAIVRIDRASDALAEEVAIVAGDVAVSLALPSWSGLQFTAMPSQA
ncbi:MAG: YgfZ/GcvT domain-containing protein [Allorhizobium sp.]